MTTVPTAEVSRDATVPPPGVYRHFKGAEYELLYIARDSETEELLAVYCALDHPETLWVRPVEMFTEMVDAATGMVPRFELQFPRQRRGTPWPGLDAIAKSLVHRVWRYGHSGLRLMRPPSSKVGRRKRNPGHRVVPR